MKIIRQEENYYSVINRTKDKFWREIRNNGIKYIRDRELWHKMLEIVKNYKDLGEIKKEL